MRGTLPWMRSVGRMPRIIPAYAGNTVVVPVYALPFLDHPRVCGEHGGTVCVCCTWAGSSPRMRGTQGHESLTVENAGIIPAYAGNTSNCSLKPATSWDHPRVCGEHLVVVVLGEYSVGIIPAYAGNTSLARLSSCSRRDHPRVCGEHTREELHIAAQQGSSPRMRGTHDGRKSFYGKAGIIPAYAGNTYNRGRCGTGDRDHPRVCGEHLLQRALHCAFHGSSPRMRGTLRWCVSPLLPTGIIPAYAGNTG